MKRLTLVQLGVLLSLALACGDDTTSVNDTDADTESGDTSDSMPTMPATTTPVTTSDDTVGETEVNTNSTTGGIDPTTGDETSGTTDTTTGETTTDTAGESSTGDTSICGNDVIEGDEECDGAELGDAAACPFFGEVVCADDCTLDSSGCYSTLVMCNTPGTAIDATTTGAVPALDVMSIVEDGFVTDVNVQVQATHTWAQDIVAVLISPDDTEGSLLLDGSACPGGADDVDALFDDETGVEPACGTPAIDGPIAPATPLNRLIGISSLGDWTLATWDLAGFADDGTLDQWCLELTLSEDDPVMCGDGVAHYGEACDTDDLKGNTCEDAGDFIAGEVSCADDCTFDTSACIAPGCGNGIVEDGEDCEGDDLDGETCASLEGFYSGDLACADDCTFDTIACSDVPPPGETCGSAFVIDETALPYTDSGDTLNFSNDYGYSTGACPGEGGGWNAGAEDVVYQITPDTTGIYTIEFATTWDSTVYTVTDCADIDNSCVGGADSGNPETIVTELVAGETYFIIGGHWSNSTPGSGGAYTLSVSAACIPVACDGISCGDNGCGGTCGCDDGELCNDGTCGPPPIGDQCGNPFIVDALPYSDSGNVDDYSNDYGYASGSCPGETSGWNGGAEDVVYAFTPETDGDYEIVFDTTWDSTIYMVTDCEDVNNTCIAGEDNGEPETINATLTGGTTYYIIGGHWSNFALGGGDTYTLSITEVTP